MERRSRETYDWPVTERLCEDNAMKMRSVWMWAAAVAWVGVLAACSTRDSGTRESTPVTSTPKTSVEARQQAQQMFSTRCAACHGPEGRGNGPAAVSLKPPPRNYHDPVWQASVTDDEIEKAIVYGGAAVGRSPAMVGNPDLGGKPEVVAALREMVRTFGKEK